jgi:hypothetical protein
MSWVINDSNIFERIYGNTSYNEINIRYKAVISENYIIDILCSIRRD